MKSSYLLTLILVVIVGTGGFFGGMKYQQSKTPGRTRQFQQRTGQGFRPVYGEIINQDDKSITVKLSDGSSKIVILTDTTSISKSSEGSKSDIKAGDRVAVFGTQNSDGSVTALNIQLNPVFRNISTQGQQ